MNIVNPAAYLPIIEENGTMSDPFRLWVQNVTNFQTLSGSGSPEGTVTAPITTFYMDEDGASGSVLYIKQKTDISADASVGWMLIG